MKSPLTFQVWLRFWVEHVIVAKDTDKLFDSAQWECLKQFSASQTHKTWKLWTCDTRNKDDENWNNWFRVSHAWEIFRFEKSSFPVKFLNVLVRKASSTKSNKASFFFKHGNLSFWKWIFRRKVFRCKSADKVQTQTSWKSFSSFPKDFCTVVNLTCTSCLLCTAPWQSSRNMQP